MIISSNKKPSLNEFKTLIQNTDFFLNKEAKKNEEYYKKRVGKDLEADVYKALNINSVGTSFENTIQLISGSSFPDIVANNYYGVEVKSTKQNKWTSVGSSILESTRIKGIERIYLTFGKLGSPVEFMSRPYEECMSGIAVTHYPRYLIDMKLNTGETIFDKIGIKYDDLRKMEYPVEPVAKYYKSRLKQGESLWWAPREEENFAPATVRLWSAVPPSQKEYYVTVGYVLFPELFKPNSSKKYSRYALWLATQQGIVNTNIRDSFSAGGQITMKTYEGLPVKMPAIFGKITKHKSHIKDILFNTDESLLMEYWGVDYIKKDRIKQWIKIVSNISNNKNTFSILKRIFTE